MVIAFYIPLVHLLILSTLVGGGVGGGKEVEGLSKKEKGLIGMDKSVGIARERGP